MNKPLTLWPIALGATIGALLAALLVGAGHAFDVWGAQMLTLACVWVTHRKQP